MKNQKLSVDKKYVIDTYNRRSEFALLNQWCFGYGKENDYIEVTEWANGDGFDVDIETSQRQRFQLTWDQYEALKALVNKIENQ